ncbi:uncharacterized protein C8Q71DRAFT_725821 [Rhodofomes roseus]|uniref:Uncharacterized protein n=1 Tax=Rhodofomes roseus TaxID=34475 RepID=A0ABQ8K7A2_9APHY|nr:uncharacterized protein C8Q71DRAFT_725821 [Rhodofomes roseus]KAH9833142.1 hypothetical protein C8Q71DRAFT_725821 [Rhodofomes roseus]
MPTKAQLEAELTRIKESAAEAESRATNKQALRVAAEELAAAKVNELNAAQEEAATAAQLAAVASTAATNQAPVAPQPPANNALIPKPCGMLGTGKGYTVQRAMGLADDDTKYLLCIRVVHEVTMALKINWQKDYAHQDPLVLCRLFRAAQEAEPYLARFQASWATADLLKQFLWNHRKNTVKKGYIPRRAERLQGGGSTGNGSAAPAVQANGGPDMEWRDMD